MSNGKPSTPLLRERITFFQEFLKHPLQIGSVIPSSRFLEQRLLKSAGLKSARTIVELGSGTGGTTQAILRAMPANARLLSIEINPQFYRLIGRIKDKRLIAHLGTASDLEDILSRYGLGAPDVIISGIPFSTMSQSAGSEVLARISAALPTNGRFVAYQVSNRVTSLCEPFLGTGRMELELFNIPPMRVFRWEKQSA
ncbi:MAG: methyltransferase type 12 [Gammaproteobacteria bacterium]|nr:methyltransferase type 12 [Gammaproteobacteria bacterium]